MNRLKKKAGSESQSQAQSSFAFEENALDNVIVDLPQTYTTDDVAHEADVSTPLHHGVIRYMPSENLSVHIRNSLPAKNDR